MQEKVLGTISKALSNGMDVGDDGEDCSNNGDAVGDFGSD